MAFFSKLKDRLFKSSSKLEQGLDAIVEDSADAPLPEAAIAPEPTPQPTPTQEPSIDAPAVPDPAVAKPEPAPFPEEKSPGLVGRLLGRKPDEPRRTLDDDMLEQLEELLIASDMGVDTALRVTANMAEGRFGKRLTPAKSRSCWPPRSPA